MGKVPFPFYALLGTRLFTLRELSLPILDAWTGILVILLGVLAFSERNTPAHFLVMSAWAKAFFRILLGSSPFRNVISFAQDILDNGFFSYSTQGLTLSKLRNFHCPKPMIAGAMDLFRPTIRSLSPSSDVISIAHSVG